ncbi:hypothetical protein V8E52_004941 [Russula decolorans]
MSSSLLFSKLPRVCPLLLLSLLLDLVIAVRLPSCYHWQFPASFPPPTCSLSSSSSGAYGLGELIWFYYNTRAIAPTMRVKETIGIHYSNLGLAIEWAQFKFQ